MVATDTAIPNGDDNGGDDNGGDNPGELEG
jgi:hypothetical protein